MYKKTLATALLICTIPAMANAAWFLTTQARNAGGTLDSSNKTGQVVTDGALTKGYSVITEQSPVATAGPGNSVKSVVITDSYVNASGFLAKDVITAPFTPVDNHTYSVAATFQASSFPVKATFAGGTVTPSSIGNVVYGYTLAKDLVFTFTPKYGYSITGVTGAPAEATVVAPGTVNAKATVTFPAGYSFTGAVNLAATAVNTSPAINQILPQSVVGGANVTVSASTVNVSNPTYSWTYVSGPANTSSVSTVNGKVTTTVTPGPALTLSGADQANLSFTAPAVPGQYKFRVAVGSLTSMATVNVINSASEAGRNQCQFCHTANNIGSPTIYSNWSSSKHGKSTATSCSACHVGANSGGHPGAPVTSDNCKSCHAAPANHAPATLADCMVCHNPHNPALKPATVSVTSSTTPDAYEPGQTTPGVASREGYVGAAACQSCHAEQYAGWSKTFHNKPLKTLAALGDGIIKNKADFVAGYTMKSTATVNPIPLARLQSPTTAWESMTEANAPALSTVNGDYFIKIANVTYKIARTQGGNGKWKQRFHTKIGNAFYVLPVQFNEQTSKYEAYNNNNWFWSNNTPMVTGGNPAVQFTNESPEVVAQVSQLLLSRNITSNNGPSAGSWDNRCAACHQTGVAIEYKSVDGASPLEVVASSADLNIGCESCHGPGESHAAAPSTANIKQPGKWNSNVGAGNYYRANEVCGQCHSRVEGFAHFSTAAGKVKLGVEAPSPEIEDNGYGKVKAESYDVGEKILHFMEQIIPGVFNKTTGASGNNGKIAYDDVPATASNAMVDFGAADKHHQQWHDMELGKHGAIRQMGSNKGLTCFSCHDAHNPNSGNIKGSINGIATNSADNTLCLACHAEAAAVGTKDTAIAALPKAGIGTDAEKDAVFEHLKVVAGYTDASKDSWKSKYLTSVQQSGSSATFGRAVYKVGQCISCHMPFTSKSGVRTSTNANGRSQGDIRNHTMKPLWPGRTGLGATGFTSTTTITSCSACHTVTN